MNKITNLKILGLLCLGIILGCGNKTINIHCPYSKLIHSDSIEGNTYYSECFYQPSGNLYCTYTMKGLQNINEEIYYYPNGKIKQYAFYNPIGEQVFLRNYDKKGLLTEEYGNFYCYANINKTKITIGDSVIIDFYVASPPNTYYKIFWIDKEGRHEIDETDTIAPYQRRLTIIPKRASSSYRLHHEIEFYDTIQKIKEIRKDSVWFDVICSANYAVKTKKTVRIFGQ